MMESGNIRSVLGRVQQLLSQGLHARSRAPALRTLATVTVIAAGMMCKVVGDAMITVAGLATVDQEEIQSLKLHTAVRGGVVARLAGQQPTPLKVLMMESGNIQSVPGKVQRLPRPQPTLGESNPFFRRVEPFFQLSRTYGSFRPTMECAAQLCGCASLTPR